MIVMQIAFTAQLLIDIFELELQQPVYMQHCILKVGT